MRRSPSPSLHLLAVAASSDSLAVAAMASHPYYRGGRGRGRRAYCDNPSGRAGPQFVSDDSHFQLARGSNRSFRPDNISQFHPPLRPSYNAVPPPAHYNNSGEQFYGPRPHFSQPRMLVQLPFPGHGHGQHSDRKQQYYRPQQQFVRNDQRLRQPQQQHRPSKPPDYREWEYADPQPPPHWERFTVLSYNILANYLAVDHRSKLYFHIPPHILDWAWRKRNIIFELGLWSADIMCFQEVDRFPDLKAELKLRGYSGIWKMRTGNPVDGCAVFWRVSRFKLLHEESIEYNKLGLRDNVAQICVFKSLNQQNSHPSAVSQSPVESKTVVVCNIHVLYNPKRGEIKLGQIRVLLDRACDVSKIWDDAPIVVCGDFNCVPKSPLYNFIADQKIDLVGLPRDQISGQASAEINFSRPFYPSNHRPQSAEISVEVSKVNCSEAEGFNVPLDVQKSPSVDDSCNKTSIDNSSAPESSRVDRTSESFISEKLSSEKASSVLNHEVSETRENTPTSPVPLSLLNQNLHKVCDKHANCNSEQDQQLACSDQLPAGDISTSSIPAANDKVDSSYGSNISCESTGIEEKLGNLSFDEVFDETKDDEGLTEDRDSFLSELHHTDSLCLAGLNQSETNHFQEVDELTQEQSGSDHKELHSPGDDILDDALDVGSSFYDPSAWTPMEMQTATGSADCTLMEHPLKLSSIYAEVKGSSGLRGLSGEPLVTSYHKRFLGTVDYIWHSEGLQAVKVLAPIPKHVMQWTHGFPTKKWGSDHIALVSELAFREDI